MNYYINGTQNLFQAFFGTFIHSMLSPVCYSSYRNKGETELLFVQSNEKLTISQFCLPVL
jgi:hypothetical protein